MWLVVHKGHNCDLFMNDTISKSNCDLFMNDTISRSNCDLLWMTPYLDLIMTFLWTTPYLDLIVTFLAKLFPQLCLCHWNGNYDLFSNFVTFLALLWPFCDLFMTFLAILWPFCDLYDLFLTFSALLWPFYEWQKRSQFYERQKWYYLDLIVTFLWPFQNFYDLFVNDKMILSRSNCDLFMTFSALLWPFCERQNDTI